MIATLVFVLAFVGLGLAVVGVALRSGKRRKGGPTRTERTATFVLVGAMTLALGVAVPAVVMIDNSDSSAKDAPGGVDLSSAQANGRKLFAKNCASCHTLEASNAVGRVGPDLDQLRPPKALSINAIELGRARGQGQMPAGLLTGGDAEDVAEYVEAVAGRS